LYPQVFGKYVLERELSRGGMARVVLATLRGAGGFEKKLVVKQIRDELSFDQQFVRRFVEEAKTTVALSHPNIVPVYELGVEQGVYFLAMELVEGCSIAELVRERTAQGQRRVLTPEEGAYVGMEVCRALDYAHRRMKVVHRDITPRNVMLDEEGQVKLIDFGIAAPARVAGHEILGSPGHMPPEQVDGKELGPPTDIFALAVLLLEAWSGVPPFRRATPEESEEAMRSPPPRPSDYDPRLAPLDEVIMRALALDPRERQKDAAELGRALRFFLQGHDVGDVARALGDRVLGLRELASDPSPMSEGVARQAAPSAGDLGTKTFAAREEAIRWSTPDGLGSRGLPSSEVEAYDEPPVASTRRIDDGAARPSAAVREAREAAGSAAKLAAEKELKEKRAKDPIMSVPTPLMVEPEAVAAIVERATRVVKPAASEGSPGPGSPGGRPGGRRTDDERGDTIATRPLETPVHPRGAPSSTPPRSRTLLVVGAAVVVASAVGIAFRARTGVASPDPSSPVESSTVAIPSADPRVAPPVSTASAPPPASASSTSTAASSGGTAPKVASLDGGGAVASGTSLAPHVSAPGAPATPASSAAEKGARAAVSFLGEPGTRVSVDGVARGACPVRVMLEPGQHDARFRFDPTGESRSEGFSVRSGEKVTVRAEFTGATPTVKIQR